MSTQAIPPHRDDVQVVTAAATFDAHRASLLSITAAEIAVDFVLLLTGAIIGGLLGHMLQRSSSFVVQPYGLFASSLVFAALFTWLLQAHRAYGRTYSLLRVKETEILLRVSLKALLICIVPFALTRYPVPRMAVLTGWLVSTGLLIGFRLPLHEFAIDFINRDAAKRRTLIYGSKRTARRFFTAALQSPKLRIEPIGFLPSPGERSTRIFSNDYHHRHSKPVYNEPLSVGLLQRLAVDDIFICDPEISDSELAKAREIAQAANCTLSMVSHREPLAERSPWWLWEMDGLMVATSRMSQSFGYQDVIKRVIDACVAAVLILLSAPVWAVLAICIRLESKGPIFFQQTRVGMNGKLFNIYKFRSMHVDAPKYASSPQSSFDPRITRIGRFMRKTSLDELPQLINVLMGEMSLVGPRPEMPFITQNYGPLEALRLQVPQGLTGLWQLSADRKFAIHESIEYDLYYIQNRTVLLDIAILLHTIVYAAKGI